MGCLASPGERQNQPTHRPQKLTRALLIACCFSSLVEFLPFHTKILCPP